jgi:predicted glycogen debranching enzyme
MLHSAFPHPKLAGMPLYSIETYGELQPHIREEWLVANGIGGYAAGTLVGCNTRRYHGLLIAANLPPVGRVMLLSRLEESLRIGGPTGQIVEFSVNQFGQIFHPRGDKYLRRFDLETDLVRWEYEIEGIRLVKELQLSWQNNATGIRYSLDAANQPVELSLLPFVRLMDFHALRHGTANLDQTQTSRSCCVKDGQNQVTITADAGEFVAAADWWYGQTYAIETERGLDDTEDLFTPGRFVLGAGGAASITLWASSDPGAKFDWEHERARRRAAATAPPANTPVIQLLTHATDDFISARKSPDGRAGSTIIAGYPWFADWGRDTMISLPGLLLATRRFEEARQVLCVFAQYVSEGMIPNRFDDYTNQPSYNTVDASLWFIHACFEYARWSKDSKTLEELLRPACVAIVQGYTQGTRYNIKVDPADGLVSQGDADTQLTWMDAKCDGIAFTPRQGKPVEINALWYHALRLLGEEKRAEQVRASFRKQFWLSPFRGLADVVDGSRKDVSLRPNQIFAASLPNSPLSLEQQQAVVEVVRRELLTPMGLRTLARSDPRYHGTYRGPQRQRDEAYHNGTVWPWLLGGFLDAYLKVHNRSSDSIEQSRRWLLPLLHKMHHGCIGQIGEIYEGDEPHRPVGCFAQAWSVAEVMRLALELGM